MENKRTITALRDILPGKVWIYLKDEEICRQFYEDAQAEGFTFGGMEPKKCRIGDVIAVHEDKTLGHVGCVGHMAFFAPEAVHGGMARVDYAKYAAGEKDFYYRDDKRTQEK